MTEKEMAEALSAKGWGITPREQFLIDMEDSFRDIWLSVSPYTMTSVERGYALYKAVEYVVKENIEGDFVECGVWKGGSCMLIALTLLKFGVSDRTIHLYDTFEGMTEPSDSDIIAWNGRSVVEKWQSDKQGITNNFTHWAVSLPNVRKNILRTAYPEENLIFVEGPVETTLFQKVPDKISLLRLDTDWYESTKAELEVLYPVLEVGGVLVIDDYGHFAGAKKAVDDYFSAARRSILLNRIDYTGRIGVKP